MPNIGDVFALAPRHNSIDNADDDEHENAFYDCARSRSRFSILVNFLFCLYL